MGLVRIVTDGAADLPAEVAASIGIVVVPPTVRFGEQVWDGPVEDFWRRVRAGAASTTAPPSVEALAAAYRGEGPVCGIHVSAELSRTFEHAGEAAALAGCPVHVADTRSLSVGTALVATAAAALDVGLEELAPLVADLTDRVHVHAVLEDVAHLLRGGRAGLVGAEAKPGIRHVMAVQGHPVLLRQHRDRRRAVHDLLDHIARNHLSRGVERWAVGHGDATDIHVFVDEAQKVFGTPPAFVTLLGPSVGSHTGPGALIVGLLSR
jgi:fatty acid kinase fatty acid binding subunit